jgi:hypothetical protein
MVLVTYVRALAILSLIRKYLESLFWFVRCGYRRNFNDFTIMYTKI